MENQELIEITERAQAEIKRIFESEGDQNVKGLRLGVVGGGCSGLNYKIDFDEKKDKDNIISFEGFNVFMDPKSTIYLKGIRLDFKDGLQGKGFVFENPNAKNTCGCGESFAV